MLENIAEACSDILLKGKAIDQSKKEVYTYGFMITISTVVAMLTIVIFSVLFSDVLSSLVFLIIFTPLRSFSGGYHCKTYLNCFIVTNLLYIATYWAAKGLCLIAYSEYMFIGILLVSAIYLFVNTPVLNANNPLSQKRVAKNKKASRRLIVIISAVLLTGMVLCMVFQINSFYICLGIVTTFVVDILMLIVQINHMRRENHE